MAEPRTAIYSTCSLYHSINSARILPPRAFAMADATAWNSLPDGATENARPHIARPYNESGHSETCSSVRVVAHINFMFAAWSCICQFLIVFNSMQLLPLPIPTPLKLSLAGTSAWLSSSSLLLLLLLLSRGCRDSVWAPTSPLAKNVWKPFIKQCSNI